MRLPNTDHLRSILLSFVVVLLPYGAYGQVVVSDDITSDATWTADNEYVLDGLVFVDSTVTLTIEAGTVIKGRQQINIESGDGASALIIRRGGKIMADGTAVDPIIFTSELDDVSLPDDLDQRQRGLWGGLIVLGAATTNQPTTENQIEGIPETENARYGGDNDEDDSGVIRYVSIRHGGFSISGVEGDEINGLTLGAVGSGTTIEFIEVFANFDDCYEWFGGTVNTKYLAGAFCGDDSYDYDQGFRGNGQYWFSIHDDDQAGRGGEHDGGDDGGDDAQPFSIPVISNVTYIGSGASAVVAGGDNNDFTFAIRDGAGGKYYNSIFTDYPGDALNIEDKGAGSSRDRLEQGDLVFDTNLWFGYGGGTILDSLVSGDFAEATLAASGNQLVDPQLNGISRTADGELDPRPDAAGPAGSGATAVMGDFFTAVDFLGAFNPAGPLWTDGWTALSQNGFTSVPETITISEDITEDATWTSDNEYILDGLVFVDSTVTLTIEAGTVIKGLQQINIQSGDGASALIIRRGGKIIANGTAAAPIIFTSELDDVSDPDDLDQRQRGLWGGLIVLGAATTNQPTTENQIEGIPETENARYGGDNDEDDSGSLRYISIRHGGFSISGVEGDEINGLTLGAVGSGTTIEFIEVFANFDDCYEWFGGTVNSKWLAGAFCGDDSYDYDQGFRGKGQYWFSIHDDDQAGRGGEHDGGDDGGDDAQPFSIPVISNATYIGSGEDAVVAGGDNNDFTFAIRDGAGGKYWNSIFTDYPGDALNIEDKGAGSSRDRLEQGDLVFNNNLWFGYGGGTILDSLVAGDFAEAALAASGNQLVDPQLAGISRTADGNLDPRPNFGSPALGSASDVGDDFFDDVTYMGAFDGESDLWLQSWTALSANGFLGNLVVTSTEDELGLPEQFALRQNYPNPFNPTTTIAFVLDQAQYVRIAVYDILGRQIATLEDGQRAAGVHEVSFDATNLTSGMYFYQIQGEKHTITKTMTLLK